MHLTHEAFSNVLGKLLVLTGLNPRLNVHDDFEMDKFLVGRSASSTISSLSMAYTDYGPAAGRRISSHGLTSLSSLTDLNVYSTATCTCSASVMREHGIDIDGGFT